MTVRQASHERREQVVAAAVREFAERGYEAASTAAIARRAGISQPYIYALFESKKELFLVVHDHVVNRIGEAFALAARGAADPQDALARMGRAYRGLVEDRHLLVAQLQAFAAAGDPDIGARVARGFTALVEAVRGASGAAPEEVEGFFARGMLLNVTTALGLPEAVLDR